MSQISECRNKKSPAREKKEEKNSVLPLGENKQVKIVNKIRHEPALWIAVFATA